MNDMTSREPGSDVLDYVLLVSYLSMPALRRRERVR